MKVEGFRAPEFSLLRSTSWAWDILAEEGITYDSSVFPIIHRRYGIPGFPRDIRTVQTPNGRLIREYPLSTLRVAGFNVPIAGGGYFRLLPLSFIREGIKQLNNRNIPAVLYFHPYEFDSKPLRLKFQNRTLKNWAYETSQNLGRKSVGVFLHTLCSEMNFTSIKVLNEQCHPSPELFQAKSLQV